MGRGGPREPEVITVPPTVESLVELSRSGGMLRPTISRPLRSSVSQPSGAGAAEVGSPGGVATSNVAEGARVAVELDPDLVVFDGSGAALPPVAADRTVVVVGGHQDPRSPPDT